MKKAVRTTLTIGKEVLIGIIITVMILAAIIIPYNISANCIDKFDYDRVDSESSLELGLRSDDELDREDLEFLIRANSPLVDVLLAEEDEISSGSETSDDSDLSYCDSDDVIRVIFRASSGLRLLDLSEDDENGLITPADGLPMPTQTFKTK